jgi:hypothetical protein
MGDCPRRRHAIAPISVRDAFLTVAIMSVAFLIEIGFFALIGMS